MKRSELKNIIREEIKNLKEARGLDSHYLQKLLGDLYDDMKRYEPDDAAFYQFLKDRINQSFPDGDVTRRDIDDILREPQARKVTKKINASELVDELFDM